MKRPLVGAACWLAAFAILSTSLPASAVPKAAEHENAPVTFGTETPKPPKTQIVKKSAPAKTKSVSHNRRAHATGARHRK